MNDGAAQVGVKVVVARELVVAFDEALVQQVLTHVGRLERTRLVGGQVGAVELVAAGLDQKAQGQARALRLGAFRRGRGLHLLVGVVVAEVLIPEDAVVARQLVPRSAVRVRAGRRGSTDRVAADVELRHRQTWEQQRQSADAAAERQLLQLLLIPVGRDIGRVEIDRRRLTHHRHRCLERGEFHLAVDRHRAAGRDDHALDGHRRELGEREDDAVLAGWKQCQSIRAFRIGHDRALAANHRRAGDGHRHAWQHATAGVQRSAGDGRCRRLRECRTCENDERNDHGESSHLAPHAHFTPRGLRLAGATCARPSQEHANYSRAGTAFAGARRASRYCCALFSVTIGTVLYGFDPAFFHAS